MKFISSILIVIFSISFISSAQSQDNENSELRPMTFLDIRKMKSARAFSPSPDGKWMLYTVTTPNWDSAKSQSDIFLVSTKQGISSTRQMTFTDEKSENSPKWAKDGSYFVFLSNRDGDKNQLYLMLTDGGEARKITKAKEGVDNYEFSKDGKWLAYKSGKKGDSQLYFLPAFEPYNSEPEKITNEEFGINDWEFSPDGQRIFYQAKPFR